MASLEPQDTNGKAGNPKTEMARLEPQGRKATDATADASADAAQATDTSMQCRLKASSCCFSLVSLEHGRLLLDPLDGPQRHEV